MGCYGCVCESCGMQLGLLCGCCDVFLVGVSIVFVASWVGTLLGFWPYRIVGGCHVGLLDVLIKRISDVLELALGLFPLYEIELFIL